MNGKLKALGLSLLALLALSATTAPAANASLEFTAEGQYPITMDGTGVATDPTVFAGENEIVCKVTKFGGSVTALEKGETPSEVTVEPIYEECEDKEFPEVEVEFTANECVFLLHVNEKLANHVFGGTGDILCEPGDEMEIDISFLGFEVCNIKVPEQAGLGTIDYLNDTNGAGNADDDVTTKMTILNELHYTVEALFGCPLEAGTFEDGSYKGTTTVIATRNGVQTGYRMRAVGTG